VSGLNESVEMETFGLTKFFFRSLVVLLFLVIGTGCTSKHSIYTLNIGDDVAFIKPTNGIRILEIDDTMLDIIPDGYMAFKFGRQKYSSVSVSPGHHKVVVDVAYFREGSVFFLDTDFQKNTLNNVKFEVLDRVEGKSAWILNVWIEDTTHQKIVSKIIKNI
jgi:hypothetical protein